ncbi:MAG TPA: PSD1 and planctomycete cytochrome C domain-containing protein [Gemmataceae bacterium]|jgi:mono/diheme cytochrome c family protein
MRTFLLIGVGLIALPARLPAGESVDYLRDVKPVLRERCFACHGSLKQQAKLRLDTAALIRRGGRHGPAIQAGDAEVSLLIRRITEEHEPARMPPQGKPLSDKQIASLKTWIDAGAPAPSDEIAEEDPRLYWAFQKPVRPPLPSAQAQTCRCNPVDTFLAAERARRGVQASPPAERATLLRRVYLDLIGLPPTREQLQAFLADAAPDAYEKVVDLLLSSPQYGERWGRHWMDVWRYSDWYGRRSVPDVMNSYPQIWRWRDWIVRSLNENKGYDGMIVAMLAADEVSPDDEESLAATGFLVRNWFKWNYNQWMRDNVEHTGKAFLGLTLNCCHCHDHKYDPITQQEYFRFRAFFEPLELRHDRVAGEPDPGPFKKYVYGVAYGPIASGRIRVFDEKLDAETFFYTGGDERNRVGGKPAVSPGAPAALGGDQLRIEPVQLPPQAWYPGLKPFVQREETERRQTAVAAAETALEKARTAKDAQKSEQLAEARLAAARSDLASIRARIAADKVIYLGAKGDAKVMARAASRAEQQFKLDAIHVSEVQAENALESARQQKATPAQLLPLEKQLTDVRAQVARCRAPVAEDSTTYTPLSRIYPRTSTGRRTALARWIASKENPLTARVAVNHIWNWHFGQPLVESTYNFGRSGARPSHPKLLDWLAVELMANDWHMKPLHRLIVTSEAYRQSSQFDRQSQNHKIDPEDRLLWHFPPRRMEAEEVRDGLLFVSGELDLTMGGPEIPQEQGLTSRRRSLYFAHHGEAKMEFLELFDAANACEAYRRSTSVLPQQALALSNSELALRQGRVLARKVWRAIEADTTLVKREEAFVQKVFEQVLGRVPSTAECNASAVFLNRQEELFRQQKAEIDAANKPAVAGGPSTDPAVRARENFVQALLNHNDFVTVR